MYIQYELGASIDPPSAPPPRWGRQSHVGGQTAFANQNPFIITPPLTAPMLLPHRTSAFTPRYAPWPAVPWGIFREAGR